MIIENTTLISSSSRTNSPNPSPPSGTDPISHRPGHNYISHESVHVTVNKVGPFSNPHETYRYYDLPFCRDAASTFEGQEGVENGVIVGGKKTKQGLLGGALAGDRKETSPYDITFGDQVPWRQVRGQRAEGERVALRYVTLR